MCSVWTSWPIPSKCVIHIFITITFIISSFLWSAFSLKHDIQLVYCLSSLSFWFLMNIYAKFTSKYKTSEMSASTLFSFFFTVLFVSFLSFPSFFINHIHRFQNLAHLNSMIHIISFKIVNLRWRKKKPCFTDPTNPFFCFQIFFFFLPKSCKISCFFNQNFTILSEKCWN